MNNNNKTLGKQHKTPKSLAHPMVALTPGAQLHSATSMQSTTKAIAKAMSKPTTNPTTVSATTAAGGDTS